MHRALRALDGLIDRAPVSPRFFRFCVVGTSGVIVNLAVLGFVDWLLPASWGVWEHRLAMAAGIVVSIFTNFLLHDGWTWGDRTRAGTLAPWPGRLGRFYVVSFLAAAVQWAVAVLLYEQVFVHPSLRVDVLLGPATLYLAQATGIALALFINFGANHLWTFRAR